MNRIRHSLVAATLVATAACSGLLPAPPETATSTPSATLHSTNTPSPTATPSATNTGTPTLTATDTSTPTDTPTYTATPPATRTPRPTPRPTRTPAPPPPVQSGNCNPSYPDVCLQDGIGDYDCAGGSGNGPNYVRGPFRVIPPDSFGLDRDKDGIGCE